MRLITSFEDIDLNSSQNLFSIKRDISEDCKFLAKDLADKNIKKRFDKQVSLDELSKMVASPLADDIFINFKNFCLHLGGKDLRSELRVESHDKDSCKLFHGDNVFARMIINYYGLTTEDVDDSNVNRDKLGLKWSSFEKYNCRVLKDRNKINYVEPYYIHIFFGEKSNKLARIHRAPSIEDLGLKRFTAIATIW